MIMSISSDSFFTEIYVVFIEFFTKSLYNVNIISYMKGINIMIYKNELGLQITPCEGHKN